MKKATVDARCTMPRDGKADRLELRSNFDETSIISSSYSLTDIRPFRDALSRPFAEFLPRSRAIKRRQKRPKRCWHSAHVHFADGSRNGRPEVRSFSTLHFRPFCRRRKSYSTSHVKKLYYPEIKMYRWLKSF